MIRIRTTVILAALLFAGSAPAQAPPWPQGPSPGRPLPGGAPVAQSPPLAPAAPGSPDPEDVTGDNGLYGSVGYLLGWVRGDPIPVLVSTSPPGTPQRSAGVFGAIGTRALFGGKPANTEARSGFRAEVGYWFNADHSFGIEVGGFILGGDNASFGATSTGTPILARPFIDTTTGAASSLIAFPGTSAGSINVSDVAHRFYGANVDLRENLCCGAWGRLDVLLGYRGLGYTERLLIQQTVVPTSGPFAAGTTVRSSDSFATRNIFNGIDIGLRNEFRYDDWFVDLMGKVSGGHVSERLNIAGSQIASVPGFAPATSQGGLLALPSNIGSHPHHTYTLIPEVAFALGYQFSPNVRVSVGYWALLWPNTVRPGDQIDTLVNPALLPPATATTAAGSHPIVTNHHNSDLWVQALTFNLEFRY